MKMRAPLFDGSTLVLSFSQASFLLAMKRLQAGFDLSLLRDAQPLTFRRRHGGVAAAPDARILRKIFYRDAARLPEGTSSPSVGEPDRNFKEYISSKKPNDHGYAISDLEWSRRVRRVSDQATISKMAVGR